MPPAGRKLALATHLTFSVGWIGAVIAYVALGLAAVKATAVDTVRAAWVAMELIGWYVIAPLAVGSLLTGLIMALGTRWGLVRYYWVLFSFALTLLANVVLLLHLPSVSIQADSARTLSELTTLRALGGGLFHSTLGLVLLVVILSLNVYKPPGMTTYGWRRQSEARRDRT